MTGALSHAGPGDRDPALRGHQQGNGGNSAGLNAAHQQGSWSRNQRTLTSRKFFDHTGSSNGPAEALNGRLERLRLWSSSPTSSIRSRATTWHLPSAHHPVFTQTQGLGCGGSRPCVGCVWVQRLVAAERSTAALLSMMPAPPPMMPGRAVDCRICVMVAGVIEGFTARINATVPATCGVA